jgi:hypothetical protein
MTYWEWAKLFGFGLLLSVILTGTMGGIFWLFHKAAN